MFSENVGQNLSLEITVAYIKKGYNTASVLLALSLLCQYSQMFGADV